MAVATVAMTLWGGASFATISRIAATAPLPIDGFESLMLALLVTGLTGVCVTSVMLAIGWLPAAAIGRYAAFLLHPRRRRFALVVYLTPLMAFSLCALAAATVGPTSAWLPTGALIATLPTAFLWTLHAWVLRPQSDPRKARRSAFSDAPSLR